MLVYHGSKKVVEKPNNAYLKPYRDFGCGFYLSTSEEKAKGYATSYDSGGYISKYELDTDGLKVLKLTDYPILSWLSILYKNRKLNKRRLKESTLEYLNKNFFIDITKYDVVIGYRCDDMCFSIAEAFFNNVITVDTLDKLIIQSNENIEVALLSNRAIDKLKFIGYEKVDNVIYYKKREKNFELEFSRFAKLQSDTDVGELLRNNTAKKMINNLGICISFACKYLGFQADEFFKLFSSSIISIEYAKANPKYIYGMSGVELAYEVLYDLGFNPKNVDDYEIEKDANYWVGRVIGYIRYVNDYSYKYLAEIINLNSLLDHFEELVNEGLGYINEYVFTNLVSTDTKSRLQVKRKLVDLSQSELAQKANINIRTLQQYEIKNKNINNASVTSVIRLADAIGCKIDDILEYSLEKEEEETN